MIFPNGRENKIPANQDIIILHQQREQAVGNSGEHHRIGVFICQCQREIIFIEDNPVIDQNLMLTLLGLLVARIITER